MSSVAAPPLATVPTENNETLAALTVIQQPKGKEAAATPPPPPPPPPLHDDIWQSIALYLEAPDILSLLQVNRSFYGRWDSRGSCISSSNSCTTSTTAATACSVWQALCQRDEVERYGGLFGNISFTANTARRNASNKCKEETKIAATAELYKHAFLQVAHQQTLASGVVWQALRHDDTGSIRRNVMPDNNNHQDWFHRVTFLRRPDDIHHHDHDDNAAAAATAPGGRREIVRIAPREAHLALVMSHVQALLVTQGFTEDNAVYLRELNHNNNVTTDDTTDQMAMTRNTITWQRILPHIINRSSSSLQWAYGCSLIPLPYYRHQDDHNHVSSTAIRFGGFRSGGYTNETNQVALLTVTKNIGSSSSSSSHQPSPTWQAAWRVQDCQTQSGRPISADVARAYPGCALLFDRFLVVVGGMQSRVGSILSPCILDVQTWTWLDQVAVAAPTEDFNDANSFNNTFPMGRHGSSLIWDDTRQRLLLCGGSTGSDILRSGRDVCDVWQLAPRKGTLSSSSSPLQDDGSKKKLTAESFVASLPWEWTLLHPDQNLAAEINNSSGGQEADQEMTTTATSSPLMTRLSPAESLCLGRCHASHRIARNTVLFVFGSSQPSTNGILGYDLRRDKFFRCGHVGGCLPVPRLCFASVFLPQYGAIWVHSGWSTQRGGVVDSMSLLHLTPRLVSSRCRHRPSLPLFDTHPSPRVSLPVTDEEAQRHRQRNNIDMEELLLTLMHMADPREAAYELLNEGNWSVQETMLLNMVATGTLQLREGFPGGEDNEDDDDEDDDDDDEDEDFELSD